MNNAHAIATGSIIGTTRVGQSLFSVTWHKTFRRLILPIAALLLLISFAVMHYVSIIAGSAIAGCAGAVLIELLPDQLTPHYGEKFWKEIPIEDYLAEGLGRGYRLTADERTLIGAFLKRQIQADNMNVTALVQRRTLISSGQSWDSVLGPIQTSETSDT
jgi:hypothetical protein